MRALILFVSFGLISLSFGDSPKGWLSFKGYRLEAHGLPNGENCDTTAAGFAKFVTWNQKHSWCDPYLEIYIAGFPEPFLKSDPVKDSIYVDVFKHFVTPKITKDTKIAFSMWDKDVLKGDLIITQTLTAGECLAETIQNGSLEIRNKSGRKSILTIYGIEWKNEDGTIEKWTEK